MNEKPRHKLRETYLISMYLIMALHLEYIMLKTNKNINNLIRNGQNMGTDTSGKKIFRCCTSLDPREMYINTTTEYHYICQNDNNEIADSTIVGKDVEKPEFSDFYDENVKYYNHFGKQFNNF